MVGCHGPLLARLPACLLTSLALPCLHLIPAALLPHCRCAAFLRTICLRWCVRRQRPRAMPSLSI